MRTFETFTLFGRKFHTQKKKGVRKENHESGKRERGVEEGSSFSLNTPENAVTKLTVPILLEHGTPTISAEIEGMSRSLILDTGANISIMQLGISRSKAQVTTLKPHGVTEDVLGIRGQQSVTFLLNGSEFTHSFLVCSPPLRQLVYRAPISWSVRCQN